MKLAFHGQAVNAARSAVLGPAKVAAIIALGGYLFNTGRIKDPRFGAFAALVPSYTALLAARAERAG